MSSPTNGLAHLSLESSPQSSLRPIPASNNNLKRKRSPLAHPDDDSPTSSATHTNSAPSPSPSTPPPVLQPERTVPKLPAGPVHDTGIIRCICGIADDDGDTIFCDLCGYWQHITCVFQQHQPALPPNSPGNRPLPPIEADKQDDVVNRARASSPSASPSDPSRRSSSPSTSRGPTASSSKPKTKPKSKSPSLSLTTSKSKSVKPPPPKPVIPEILPDQWFCERCVPRPVDAQAARERQLARIMADRGASVSGASTSAAEVVTDEAEMDDVDIDDAPSTSNTLNAAGPSPPMPPNASGKRKMGGGGGEKRRRSNAADTISTPTASTSTAAWGGPPPPRRASAKTSNTPSISTTTGRTGGGKRGSASVAAQSGLPGLSKREEDMLLEPWANECIHIQSDVVTDRRVREHISRWAQRLLDEEEDWCRTTPLLSSNGRAPSAISPISNCIPVHPFSAVFTSSVPSTSSTSGALSSSSSIIGPNAKKVKVQVRSISMADSGPLPSPSVCPASPIVTPSSAYPFPSSSSSHLNSPLIGGPSFFDSPAQTPNGSKYASAANSTNSSSAGYSRPPTYGLYTSCPTAAQQNSSGANAGYFTSPIPAGTLLAPLASSVSSLESYVCSPSSQYSLLQTAKPFVHLIGSLAPPRRPSVALDDEDEDDEPAPLSLALDAREMGSEARWARSGCFPNAVIRPVLSFASSLPPSSPIDAVGYGFGAGGGGKTRPKKGGQAELTLSWALFSTRQMNPRGEEIVLGWEWDRGSAVHRMKKVLVEGCADVHEETELRSQLSQILFTMGGTLTSCACGRQNTFGNSPMSNEPMRECVFSLIARFVSERSRFVGKPSAGLSMMNGNGTGVPMGMFPATPSSRILGGPALSSGLSSSRKASRSNLNPNTPTPKLTLDASFDRWQARLDLGPMVGWPLEHVDVLPLGVVPGVCALPLPATVGGWKARSNLAKLAAAQRSSSPASSSSASQPGTPVARPSTPPPMRNGNVNGPNQSHSAPPHFASTSTLMARNGAAAGSPLARSGSEVVIPAPPARKGWADVVGLYDYTAPSSSAPPVASPSSMQRSSSPSPSMSSLIMSGPPSMRGRGRGSTVTNGRINPPALPKIQTGSSIVPSLAVHPPPSTPRSTTTAPSSALPTTAQDTASFAASLSSMLGLDMDEDMADGDTSLEAAETESQPESVASYGLADEEGADGSVPAKLPPWARKRVRSSSFVPATTPLSSASPSTAGSGSGGVLGGTSMSLPHYPSSALAEMTAFSSQSISETMSDTTEDVDMDDGTVKESEAASIAPRSMSRETSSLPPELIVDPSAMPPPPLPASQDPTTVTSISLPPTPTVETEAPSFPIRSPTPPPLDEPVGPSTVKIEVEVQPEAENEKEDAEMEEESAMVETLSPLPVDVPAPELEIVVKREPSPVLEVSEPTDPASLTVDEPIVPRAPSPSVEPTPPPIPALETVAPSPTVQDPHPVSIPLPATEPVSSPVAVPEPDPVSAPEPTPAAEPEPAAPPVRMSFLDWKKKRGQAQKEKAVEPAALPSVAEASAASSKLEESAVQPAVPAREPESLIGVSVSPVIANALPSEATVIASNAEPAELAVVVEQEKQPTPVNPEPISVAEPAPVLAEVEASVITQSAADDTKMEEDDPVVSVLSPEHAEDLGATSAEDEVKLSPQESGPPSPVEPTTPMDVIEHDAPVKETKGQDSSHELPSPPAGISPPPLDSLGTMTGLANVATVKQEPSLSPPLTTASGGEASADAEDAEDGEIVDMEDVEDAAPRVVVSVLRSSTPVSSSSRDSPAPRQAARRQSPPLRDRVGPPINGNSARRSTFSNVHSFAPGSPADSHSSSVSDRDRDDYRHRRPPSPSNSYVAPTGHSPAFTDRDRDDHWRRRPSPPPNPYGAAPGYDPYPRMGGGYRNPMAAQPWYPPGSGWHDLPRYHAQMPPANVGRGSWGQGPRTRPPPQGYRNRDPYPGDRSRSPSLSGPPMGRRDAPNDDTKERNRRNIDNRALEAEAYKARLPQGSSQSPSSFDPSNAA